MQRTSTASSSHSTHSTISNFFSSFKSSISKQTHVSSEIEQFASYDPAKEPIKSYLRIRSDLSAQQPQPYISVLDDATVEFRPQDGTSTAAKYKFTKVFGPETKQTEFFVETAFPMIKDVLTGSSGLLFAYGVSNSDTIQGPREDPGLLPRCFDVVFNSIQGMHSSLQFRPAGLASVEVIPKSERNMHSARSIGVEPPSPTSLSSIVHDNLAIPLSQNYEYSVWISYAEVYNDKVYDLLLDSKYSVMLHAMPQHNTSYNSSSASMVGLGIGTSMRPSAANIKRKALSLKQDKASGCKYIAGLREIRVFDSAEARAVIQRGQAHRKVFSTFLNRASSRSHAILSLRIVRNLKHCDADDPQAASCSRLCVVDLAGSERSANTGAMGDRLKEAGNINKSLMVLGQCMEVLRRNQMNKERHIKPAVVPFRHSKLTEIFQSFFVNDGKTAMIVNVNPYDTGFEENSHVMRFSSVAKQITTIRQPVMTPQPSKVIVPLGVPEEGSTCDLTIEEVEPDSDEDDEGEDEMLRYLFDDNQQLRNELFETKIRLKLLETDVRQSLVDEYEERIRQLEDEQQKRLQDLEAALEHKMDMKIDILNRAHAEALAELEASDEDESEEDPVVLPTPVTAEIAPIKSGTVDRLPLTTTTPSGQNGQAFKPRRSSRNVGKAKPAVTSHQPASRAVVTVPDSEPEFEELDHIPPVKSSKGKPVTRTSTSTTKPVYSVDENEDPDDSVVLLESSGAQQKKKKFKLGSKKNLASLADLEANDDSFVRMPVKSKSSNSLASTGSRPSKTRKS